MRCGLFVACALSLFACEATPFTCPPGEAVCGDSCVPLERDPLNCGACGHVCISGACSGGACTTCPESTTQCVVEGSMVCVNTRTDPANCGDCNALCASDEVCKNGTCTTSCGPFGSVCKSECVDTFSDPANCGSCGNHCIGDCHAGTCSPAVAIASGVASTCALLADASVWCWGFDQDGELADLAFHNSPVPVRAALPAAKALAFGEDDACIIDSLDSAVCWGGNLYGPAPIGVGGLVQISPGQTSCGVFSGGQVACWGKGSSGQLGNGGTSDSTYPLAVDGLVDAKQVGASDHACAIRGTTGSVACWGSNDYGELGIGTTDYTPHPYPVEVSGITDAQSIVVSYGFTCVLLADSSVDCWGKIGTSFSATTPTPIGLTGVAVLAGRDAHLCAAMVDGTARCWGESFNGIQGDVGLTHVVSITTGSNVSCALINGGSVYCWGDNLYGELGNGTTTPSKGPVQVL